ncbi:hypothetical protein HMPREF1207_04718 [Paenibacillus sp. HGH0039]|nr:hypothetical protein HMPREF1207_04718 [Paenibacillus sp. HGH0039]
MACKCPDGEVLAESRACLTGYCTANGTQYPKILTSTKTIGCTSGTWETVVCTFNAGCCY